jgi:hypothetical protein
MGRGRGKQTRIRIRIRRGGAGGKQKFAFGTSRIHSTLLYYFGDCTSCSQIQIKLDVRVAFSVPTKVTFTVFASN